MKKLVFLIAITTITFSWEGYDRDSGSCIEIEKGNLVRRGKNIEIYDYKDNKYKKAKVQWVRKAGRRTQLKVYDKDSGKHRTFEMQNNNRRYGSDISGYDGIKSYDMNNRHRRLRNFNVDF